MAADRAMVYEFVSEAKEHLANVTDDLLALEKAPEDLLRYRIDRLFRGMHSVKGGAGFFAFHNITELAHLMETLLKRLRERAARPDETQLDALLAGTDLILTLLDDVERSNQVDITLVRERLQRLVSGGHGPADASAASWCRGRGKGQRLYAIRCDLVAFCRSRQQRPSRWSSRCWPSAPSSTRAWKCPTPTSPGSAPGARPLPGHVCQPPRARTAVRGHGPDAGADRAGGGADGPGPGRAGVRATMLVMRRRRAAAGRSRCARTSASIPCASTWPCWIAS